jgi:predicted ATPase
MIFSIRFIKGYQVKLPGIRKKTITFNDRLNILSGPNGSGKSTIIRALAEAAGCGNGGWSEPIISEQSKDVHGFIAEWDMKPVFFQDCYTDSEKSLLNPAFFDDFSHLRSSGEKRIGLINELINYIEDRFLTYKLKREDRPTLLLDEIDNHIGFAGQALLWKEIFPRLLKKYQLIVSTHSIFPLLLKKESSLRQDNIISLHSGYEEICINELAKAVDYYNSCNTAE